jgi:RimJ/RimL family protein N-acetyltransferase
VIETERLLVRPLRLEDAPDLAAAYADPETVRYLGDGSTATLAEVEERIAFWLTRWDANGLGLCALERREDGRVLGRAGFLVWDRRTWQSSSYAEAGDAAETELGWTLAREHWGHGYATEAALAARDWAYEERGVERIISLIAPDNARSIRVAEKLGAAPEETISTFHGPATVWVHPR